MTCNQDGLISRPLAALEDSGSSLSLLTKCCSPSMEISSVHLRKPKSMSV